MTKRLTSLVLIVTLMFGGSIVPDSSAVQAASKADNAKKQYKKILRSVNGNADFWCYDINHDGVLELLLNEVSGSGISKLYYYHTSLQLLNIFEARQNIGLNYFNQET